MSNKFRPAFGKKVNCLLAIAVILLLSFSTIAFASTQGDLSDIATSANKSGRIAILLDSTELGYVPELKGMEYYYAEVKHFLPNASTDILDPASVMWSTNNPNVAEILDSGAIIPKSEGKAVITAEYKGLKDTIEIAVKKGFIKKFDITQKDLSLSYAIYNEKTKMPCELHALVETSYGKVYEVSYNDATQWTSGDSSIVSVDEGFLAIHGVGSTKITAAFHGLTASSNIKIKDTKLDIKKIKINKENVVIDDTNGTTRIRIQAVLDDGSIQDISKLVKWESTNPSVAVAYDGRIDAMSEGETVINVSYLDYHKSIKVKVKDSNGKTQVKHSLP